VRWAAALLALVIVLAAAGAVWAILASHDTPPDDIASCALDDGARRARGEEGLQVAREDIRAGTLRPVRRWAMGEDEALLLDGTGFRVLVVGVPGGPPLRGADLPFRLYRRTASFATVLLERDPLRGVLERCVAEAGGEPRPV